MREQIVLMVRHGWGYVHPKTFKAIAADGSEMGMVVVRLGWRPRQIIQADGETIGSLWWANSRAYSVRDAQGVEVGLITHMPDSLIRQRVECNVIEIDDGMPDRLRALMLAASKAVSHLNAPSA